MSVGDRALAVRALQWSDGAPQTAHELELRMLTLGHRVETQGVMAALNALVKAGTIRRKWLSDIAQNIYWLGPQPAKENAAPSTGGSATPASRLSTPLRTHKSPGTSRLSRPFSTPKAGLVARSPGGQSQTPQSQTAMTLEELEASVRSLEQEVAELSEQYNDAELEHHIKRLHDYNEMRDVAQPLLAVLAQQRNLTTKQMYAEFDLELED